MPIAANKGDNTPAFGDHAAHHNEIANAVNANTAGVVVVKEALPLIPGLVSGVDNTAAIAAWYDALPPAGGAGRFPPGLFLWDGAISRIFTKPVELEGASLATELRKRGTEGQHFLWMRGDRSKVRNMYVNGMRSAQLTNTGSAVNFSGTGADDKELVPVKDVKMANCRVSGNGFDCVGLVAVDGFDLTDIDCDEIYDTGFDLVEGTCNGTIKGGTIRCAGRWGFGADTAYEQSVGTGNTTNGSNQITNVAVTLGVFQATQKISGPGIPAGATITNVAGTTLTISANATATASGVAIAAVGYKKVRNVKVIGTTVVMLAGADNRQAFLAQTTEQMSFIGVTADLQAAGICGIRCDENSRLISIEAPTIVGGASSALYGVQWSGLSEVYPVAVAQDKQGSLLGGDILGFAETGAAGVQLDNPIGIAVKGTKVRECKRGFDVEGSSARPVSDVLLDGTDAVGCDTSYRFGGTTGANKARLVNARSRSATSFDWALDPAWTVRHMGETPTSVYKDAAATIIRETADLWHTFPPVEAGDVPNNSIFRDAADNVLKRKNNAGASAAI